MWSAEGTQLSTAFMQVEDPKVKRHIIQLVRSLAKEAQSVRPKPASGR
jgi:hypothetical protein